MTAPVPPDQEADRVVRRYARRQENPALVGLYDPWRPEVVLARQERERAIVNLARRHHAKTFAQMDVLEIGCGDGNQLLELLRLGVDAKRLVGSELLPERVASARQRLPAAVTVIPGDACALPFQPASFDLVVQMTVFSSLLDDAFQHRLASAMWTWVRPGGAVLWYDFTVNNPRNPDVRGVPLSRVRALFPGATIDARRVTLAPPLARPLCRLHPLLYPVVNAVPLLRTHRLAWIEKPHE